MPDHPAIALIEFSSIAAGTRASDALVKKAPIMIVRNGTYQPGRYAILFSGEVAAVQESLLEAARCGGECVLDRVLLPDVHEAVHAAAMGRIGDWGHDTLGIVETATLAAVLEAADAGVKGANVDMVQIRLGDGLGGKGLAYFGGEQADVEAALEIASGRIAHRGAPCTAIIPRLDGDLRAKLEKGTRFGDGW